MHLINCKNMLPKIVLLAVVAVILNATMSSVANSQQGPVIDLGNRFSLLNFDGVSEQDLRNISGSNLEDDSEKSSYLPGMYPRLIGFSVDDIKKYILNNGTIHHDELYERKIKKFSFVEHNYGNYSLLIVENVEWKKYHSNQNEYTPVAVYIIQNGKSIGYCLLDELLVNRSFPELSQILSGQLNSGLTNQINTKITSIRNSRGLSGLPDYKIKIFDVEESVGEYEERYGLLIRNNQRTGFVDKYESIFLDAFYPKSYSVVIEIIIVDVISKLAYDPFDV